MFALRITPLSSIPLMFHWTYFAAKSSAGAFPATERRSPSRFFVLVGAILCVWRGFRSLGGSPLIPDDASRSKVKTTLLARGSGGHLKNQEQFQTVTRNLSALRGCAIECTGIDVNAL